MANNKLILRNLISPWVTPFNDTTKGSVLSWADLDNNFIYLKGELFYSGYTSGTDLILNKINGTSVNLDLSALVNAGDTYITGGTFNQLTDTLTLTNNGGNSVDVSGFTNEFTGNTSGDCIVDLWVSNVHGCSPVTFHDSIQSSGSTSIGLDSISFGDNSIAGASSPAIIDVVVSGYSIEYNYGPPFMYVNGDFTTQYPITPITLTLYGGTGVSESYVVYTVMFFDDKTFFLDDTSSGVTNTTHNTFSATVITQFAIDNNNSFALGLNVIATGNTSFASGLNTIASGAQSHAEGDSTIASGITSHSEGYLTTASGGVSHSEGYLTKASGNYSHAEGVNTLASGLTSHAEGDVTIASGAQSHAEGGSSMASGQYSHAEGYLTTAIGQVSHAEGGSSMASGQYSHAEGYQTTAIGLYSHAEGYDTTASGENSHAEGYGSNASGYGSHAEGGSFSYNITGGTASGAASHAEGRETTASGDYSHAEGIQTTAINVGSHSEGYQTKSIGGYGSHAEGASTIASGVTSHAEGYLTKASGNYSHTEGYSTTASGSISHSEGYTTKASGDYSHAEGKQTTASGITSHAEGTNTLASGGSSHAEGQQTTASGLESHAEGQQTIASGGSSHAEGNSTTASGLESHAEGYYTIASGITSHAEGRFTNSSGYASHSEGIYTIASGYVAHGEGYLTKASGDYSHAEGRDTTSSGFYSHAGGQSSIASGSHSFIHSTNSRVTAARSAVLGGQNITGSTADTVYVPYLNLNYVPANDNVLTQVLVRATDGTVKYKSISSFTDMTVTGGTYDPGNGIATFTNNSGGTFNVSGFLTGMTDFYTTGITINGTTLEFNRTDTANAYSVNLSGITNQKYAASIPFTGGTVQTITHNLNDTDVVVQLKDSTGKLIIPDVVNNYTLNTVNIKVSSTETYRVIIIG